MTTSQLHPALVRLALDDDRRVYQPGESLAGQFTIDVENHAELRAVELSALWYTDGKGDEDMAVHFFDRLDVNGQLDVNLREPHYFTTVLPNSPLSYEGQILKIRWCVRLRVFLRHGKDLVVEEPFQLGAVPPAPCEPP
jgi:hypothetical protein